LNRIAARKARPRKNTGLPQLTSLSHCAKPIMVVNSATDAITGQRLPCGT
jgi:hypothetical protein